MEIMKKKMETSTAVCSGHAGRVFFLCQAFVFAVPDVGEPLGSCF